MRLNIWQFLTTQASIEKPEFHETLKQRQIYRASFTVQTKPQGWTKLDLNLDQTRWHRRWLDCLKKWFRMQLVSFRNTAWNIDSFFHFRVSALRYCARRTVLGNLGPVWRTPTVTFPFLLSSSVVFVVCVSFCCWLLSMYHALYPLKGGAIGNYQRDQGPMLHHRLWGASRAHFYINQLTKIRKQNCEKRAIYFLKRSL